jgi:hypothetical protein
MLYQIILVVVLSIVFSLLENKSNFSELIMIPLITTLSVKYILGDFDVGYVYTKSDIVFWTMLPLVSFLKVKVIRKLVKL